MFVYGVRCNRNDLATLPAGTNGDYYIEYGLLIFPEYSRPSSIRNNNDTLTARFLKDMSRMVCNPQSIYEVDLEQPWISEAEDAAVKALQSVTPGTLPAWYYVPKIVMPPVC